MEGLPEFARTQYWNRSDATKRSWKAATRSALPTVVPKIASGTSPTWRVIDRLRRKFPESMTGARKCRTGLTDHTFVDLRRTLEPLIQAACPLKNKPNMTAPLHLDSPGAGL